MKTPMTNLLQSNLTEGDIRGILNSTPGTPLLPDLADPLWREVADRPLVQKWLGSIKQLAAKEIGKPMPELTEDLYREFYANGSRVPFESAYFERRRRLARAAICTILDDSPVRAQWLESLREKSETVFKEFSWALPAHVNSPSGRDPLHVDLFAAETANMMAELLTLFPREFDPAFVAAVKKRVRRDFSENYVNRHEDFFWTKATNNWNAVCHQGILGAALAVEEDTELLARMLTLAKKYLPLFLRGFGSDGACSEGPGYWQYGFGWFCVLNEQLETRTGGLLSLIEGDPHVREIALFGPRVTLSNFHFVNFSDSPRTGALSPSLLTYLGNRLEDGNLLAHARKSYQRLDHTGLNLQGQRTDLLYFVRLLLNTPENADDDRPLEPLDVFFKDLAVLVAAGRDSAGHLWEFAAKGGNNAEQHNHNDCGSYLLNIDGSPVVVEIGAPEYTKDFFRENRYQYLAARTLGHSLPIVNGREQAAGPQYASKVISYELAPAHAEFSVDLAECYPSDAHCGELIRSFYLDKGKGSLRIKEFFDLSVHQSFETSVLTEERVDMAGTCAVIHAKAGNVIVRPFDETLIIGVETHEYRDHGGTPRKIYRIILRPSKLTEQRFVGYELELKG
ncbi:MAG TPA: heparinase II/III family protein [Chthoniobacteraceae bacterium]|jgi:hypothetical protein|nr:heparinase II/III family protein [Chthoniobacteraceae bacterium]